MERDEAFKRELFDILTDARNGSANSSPSTDLRNRNGGLPPELLAWHARAAAFQKQIHTHEFTCFPNSLGRKGRRA